MVFIRLGQGAEPERTRSRQLDRLYRQCWDHLCRRLRKVFGEGPPDPEDLAQYAFERFAGLEDFDAIDNPKAYLFKIAHNQGLNAHNRQTTARRFVEQELHAQGVSLQDNQSADGIHHARKRLRLTLEAIKALSPKQRDVLIRHRIYGETFAEIRAETGMSQGDISRQLQAALAQLQAASPSGEGE